MFNCWFSLSFSLFFILMFGFLLLFFMFLLSFSLLDFSLSMSLNRFLVNRFSNWLRFFNWFYLSFVDRCMWLFNMWGRSFLKCISWGWNFCFFRGRSFSMCCRSCRSFNFFHFCFLYIGRFLFECCGSHCLFSFTLGSFCLCVVGIMEYCVVKAFRIGLMRMLLNN